MQEIYHNTLKTEGNENRRLPPFYLYLSLTRTHNSSLMNHILHLIASSNASTSSRGGGGGGKDQIGFLTHSPSWEWVAEVEDYVHS